MKKQNKILDAMRVDDKKRIRLTKAATESDKGVRNKEDAREKLALATAELDSLQYKLYAEGRRSLLVVFQAMDTAGKDGVIRKVFGPINPQGVRVYSFKRPSTLEMSHDFLWRIHACVPPKGMICVFNRSHYEEVLVRRVRGMDPKKTIEARYDEINAFEKYLAANGTVILKFFLNISKDEQRKRLQERLDNPNKRWKFEPDDLEERKLWSKYQDAYQLMLDRCSFSHAPWYVIPADNKWYRDWAVSCIIADALGQMNPKLPKELEGLEGTMVE